MLPVNGLYGHIQRNNLKSVALFAGFLLLLEALEFAGFVLAASVNASKRGRHPQGPTFDAIVTELFAKGGFFDTGWLYALLIGLVWVAVGCTWNAYIVRFETRSRQVTRQQEPELYNLVETLVIGAGLPMPRIEVIESPVMNAFAAGFAPRFATVTVTRGLIERLTRDEAEAVIAHEITHIRHRDVRLMTVAKTCLSLVTPLGQIIWDGARDRPLVALAFAAWFAIVMSPLVAALAAVVVLAAMLAALLVRGMIARSREFVADAGAIELTRNPDALISALGRIADDDRLPHVGAGTQAMMFSSETLGWLASHPPIDERIEAIRRHATTTRMVRPSARQVRRLPVGLMHDTTPGAAATFGRKRTTAYRPAIATASSASAVSTAAHPADAVEVEVRPGPVVDWVLSGRADQHAKKLGRSLMYVMMAPVLIPLVLGTIFMIPVTVMFLLVR